MNRILFLVLMSSPFVVFAQGFQVNLQGQKQQAMGGTATALSPDAASVFFNPGAVSFLKENSVSVGVSPLLATSEYTDRPSSVVSKTTSPINYPFTGYIAFGNKQSKLKYGLGVYTPFGSSVSWQDAWTGRFTITQLRFQTVFIQPTISYQLSEKIGVGAGFVYGLGTLSLKTDIPVPDGNGDYSNLHLDGKGKGYGFNVGLYYYPSAQLSFGLNYRSHVNMAFKKGTAKFFVPESMSGDFPSGNFSTNTNLPQIITLGTAYRPHEKLTLAADITFAGWKCYDTVRYDFEKNTYAVSDLNLSRNYRNTISYRLGAAYKITGKLEGRMGLKYLSTPVQNGFVTPEIPDANHFSYSAGLGYRFSSRIGADLSFTYENIKRSDNNPEVQLDGSYKTDVFIPGISVSYAF